jgi:uncharacterized protein (DUF362 family)
MSSVSFVKINQDAIADAISNALDLINYRFQNVNNIVIKPNMCYYWLASTGHTTDPVFIGTLIDLLRQKVKADVKISIVESDASAMKCRHAFKLLGYEKLAEEYNVDLINLSEDENDVVKVKAGNYRFTLRIPRVIKNADLRINVPKLKYSTKELRITCALKNLYGCNPYPKKYKLHSKVGEAIVAINKAMKFNLCLLDGDIVIGVRTSKLGLVMASQDPVAFDAAAAKIAGFNPNSIEHFKLAQKEGIGTTTFVEKGIPLDYFKSHYPSSDPIMKVRGKLNRFLVYTGLGAKLGL